MIPPETIELETKEQHTAHVLTILHRTYKSCKLLNLACTVSPYVEVQNFNSKLRNDKLLTYHADI